MVTAQKAYQMLGNESVWKVAQQCDTIFRHAGISYSICGGVAVCLHGYQRNTVDLDMVVRPADSERIRAMFSKHGWQWDEARREFRTGDGFPIQMLMAGQKAGRDSEVAVAVPEGRDNVEEIEGMSVVRLSRLIEMKLACGMGDPRRTHRGFADVVELMLVRKLDGSFDRLLHKSVRKAYRDLVRRIADSDNA